MSYSEENGQVVLRMSREDYEYLIRKLGTATGANFPYFVLNGGIDYDLNFLNRLNSGNPNYTPYQVEDKRRP